MFASQRQPVRVAIACGGTGGHLFPGVSVGIELRSRGMLVTLIVSEKEIDQVALRGEDRFEILKLPAVGMGQRGPLKVVSGLFGSYRRCTEAFSAAAPHAVLAMGGFTSAAPVLAGRRKSAALFLHDSNAIPGRANRWLSRWMDEAFLGFPQAAEYLKTKAVTVTGTPVRPQLVRPESPAPARVAFGLDPLRPLLLIMGGSQGARGVNQAMVRALPTLLERAPELQYLHLTGSADFETVSAAYRGSKATVVVRPFLAEMELALGAATLVVSRAGASSLAEFATMGLPSILIPFPQAADDHQTANAKALAEVGAVVHLPQANALEQGLADPVLGILQDSERRAKMVAALSRWNVPDAARRIADRIEAELNRRLDPLQAPATNRGQGLSRMLFS